MSDKNNLVYREQLDDNVIEMLSEDIGNNYSLRTENTRNVVGALNEIKGKDIITNAVGSPLLVTDTFEVMGDKIKGLSNSFRTALLGLGISVSSVDKFEKLIEKLELFVDENASDADVDAAILESLKQTLIEKGVEINGSESLIELVVKVGELKPVNYSGGLNIISVTELPENGEESQICIITDNTVNDFVLTSEEDYKSTDKIVVFTTANSPNYEITSNSLLCRYCIDTVFLNDTLLDSYYYKNSTWNQLTFSNLCLLYQGRYMMESIHRGLYSGSYITYTPNTGIVMKTSGNTGSTIISAFSFKNKIDLTSYSTVEITLNGSNTISSCGCYILASTSSPFNYVGSFQGQTVLKEQSLALGTDYRTYTFDISSAKGEYYIGFGGYLLGYTITISDFKIY